MSAIIDRVSEYRLLYIIVMSAMLVVLLIFIYFKKRKPKLKQEEVIEVIDVEPEQVENNEIADVLEAMKEDLTTRQVLTFEKEQEENAIISYQELVEVANGKGVPVTHEEPIVQDVQPILDDPKPRRFRSSEFISPIYGKENNNNNDEFLKELKDFRSNLE